MSQFFAMLNNSFPTQRFLSMARPEMMKQSSYVIYHQHIHHHHYAHHPASWSSTPITSYRSLMCKCDWKYWISSWRSLDSVTSSIHSNGMPIFKTWKSSSSRSPCWSSCWSSWSWPPCQQDGLERPTGRPSMPGLQQKRLRHWSLHGCW